MAKELLLNLDFPKGIRHRHKTPNVGENRRNYHGYFYIIFCSKFNLRGSYFLSMQAIAFLKKLSLYRKMLHFPCLNALSPEVCSSTAGSFNNPNQFCLVTNPAFPVLALHLIMWIFKYKRQKSQNSFSFNDSNLMTSHKAYFKHF